MQTIKSSELKAEYHKERVKYHVMMRLGSNFVELIYHDFWASYHKKMKEAYDFAKLNLEADLIGGIRHYDKSLD